MPRPSAAKFDAVSKQHDERQVAAATRRLVLLNEKADGLRAELLRLRRELAEAQRDIRATRGAQLLEANEQLVLATLRAQTIAETAVHHEEELARSSKRDTLTGTPNRALMLDRLETAVAMARRHGTRIAVLFLDLDHFKLINDTLGHAVGDEVLRLAARRLESVVRESDTVSRHGGDEFLVVLAEISKASDAGLIATKMLSALATPARVGDHVLRLSASLGIAIYPEDADDAATLISRADAAMYRSKRRGRGRFDFHEEEIATACSPTPTKADAAQQPAMRDEMTLAEHELVPRDLFEADEEFVKPALTAQELEAHAEEAHRRQIKFLAMVAHELHNPLAPIRTAAELLKRVRTDEPLLARLQEIIERGVAHMSRLVDDLLDGSRVSTGRFRLERSTVEMAGVLNLAVETCRPAMDARRQHLTLQLPPGTLRVHGDSVRLAQIFINLLDNASKYTPEGGEIALAALVLDQVVTITVSDNGIGITAGALPHIFDLFVQESRTLAFHIGGLGIGLAVVRDLVEAHGGTVVARSAGRDLGADFVVTLPLADRPAAADLRGVT